MKPGILNNFPIEEPILAKVGLGASVSGGTTAFLGGLTLNEAAMVVGMVVGVIGLFVQIISQAHSAAVRERQDKRDAIEHEARMEDLLSERPDRRSA